MPFLPSGDDDNPFGNRPNVRAINLRTNPETGLSTEELRAALAATGERLVTEDQAALELARRRRRGSALKSPEASASARPSSAAGRRNNPDRGRR